MTASKPNEGGKKIMTQQASPILVTGATGNTGRAIVEALAERGARVRAMVRTEADRSKLGSGVEVVVADFDEAAAVAALGPDWSDR